MLNITANSLNVLYPRGRFKFSARYKKHLRKLVTCLRVVFHHIQYLVCFYLGYSIDNSTSWCIQGHSDVWDLRIFHGSNYQIHYLFYQCHGMLFDYVPACHQFSDISVSSNALPKRGLKWFPAHNCSTTNRTTHTVKLA